MEIVKTEVLFVGTNCNQFLVKDYIVSENMGKWLCTCSTKYNRDPKTPCKHIDIVKAFLLDDKNKNRLLLREEERKLREKVLSLTKDNKCNHKFNLTQSNNKSFYICSKCNLKLLEKEFKEYRRLNNLN